MTKAYKYSHAGHTSKVIKSSGVRMASLIILQYLCARAEFELPEVTITKAQIENALGLERKAVQRGLATLRRLGIIVPKRGFEGGRGVAVTYSLIDIKADQAKPDAAHPTASEVGKRRKELMQQDPRLTFGEAQALAKEQV